MGQTLTNGVYLPDEGERNCYTGLAGNWRALDNHLGNANIHVTYEDKQAWNNHIADTVKHVTAEDKAAWNGKADASALTAHTGDTTIHVTAEDKQAWNGKANDADVVHKSGNETIGGAKTFSDTATFVSVNLKDIGWKSLENQTIDLNDCYIPRAGAMSGYYTKDISSGSNISNKAANTSFILISLTTRRVSASDYNIRQEFYGSGAKYIRTCSNGIWTAWINETDKFVTTDTAQTISGSKTFSSINGVEPSSLSLPSGNVSDTIDISSYITDLSGGINEYTASVNGWITITCLGCKGIRFSITNFWANGSYRENPNQISCMIPICKGQKVGIYIYGSSPTIQTARFIPCQGNV